MARIRTVKPEITHSETLAKVSREGRLLFILLFTFVDDAGRSRASSRLLASQLYPYDDDALPMLARCLGELVEHGHVRRYIVDGVEYLDIPNWLKHQRIDHPGKSKIPPFDAASEKPAKPARERPNGPSQPTPSEIVARATEPLAPDLVPRTIVPRTVGEEAGGIGEEPTPVVATAPEVLAKPAENVASNVSHETISRPRFKPLVADQDPAPPIAPMLPLAERAMPPHPDTVDPNAEGVEGAHPLDVPVFLDQSECGAAVRIWNEVCERTGWPVIKKLTAARRAALTNRLKDVRGVRGWAEALALAEKSPFLSGKTGRGEGHENWQCNFDFIIKESKFQKLIEGGFNGLKPNDKRLEGLGGVLAGIHRATANRQSPPGSS